MKLCATVLDSRVHSSHTLLGRLSSFSYSAITVLSLWGLFKARSMAANTEKTFKHYFCHFPHFFPLSLPLWYPEDFKRKKNLAFKKVSLEISWTAYLWAVGEHSLAISQFTAKENSNWVLLLLLFGVAVCAVGCEQTREITRTLLLRFIWGILRTKSTLSCLEAKLVQLACLWLAKDIISLWLNAV